MGRVPSGFPSKNTPLRGTPLAPESPCRGPHRRINSPRCRPLKTRGLRNNADNNHARALNRKTKLPFHYLRTLRRHHNRLDLPASNRPEVPNCLLISQPYGPRRRGNSDPNTMGVYRSTYSYNRPWPDILSPLLPGKHQLRANTQPNDGLSTGVTNSPSLNGNLMVYCQPSQLSPTTPTKPDRRTNDYHLPI